jgi:DNA-binding response OmpR family regulator
MSRSHATAVSPTRGLELGLPRLLLVEDDDDLRAALTHILAQDGYEVVAVDTGGSALAELDLTRSPQGSVPEFDVVVSDIQLPGISGVYLASSIATAHRGAKTILMTSFPSSEVMDEAARLGVPVITKPFRPDIFRRIVLATLESTGTSVGPTHPLEPDDP